MVNAIIRLKWQHLFSTVSQSHHEFLEEIKTQAYQKFQIQ